MTETCATNTDYPEKLNELKIITDKYFISAVVKFSSLDILISICC